MRLLVVMTSFPFPPQTGSAIVAYNNIKEIPNIIRFCCGVAKKPGYGVVFLEVLKS
jgi:hypothetical protein